jgi:hypothetical protein
MKLISTSNDALNEEGLGCVVHANKPIQMKHFLPILKMRWFSIAAYIFTRIYPNNLKLLFLADDLWSFFEPKISKVKQLSVEIFGIKNHLKSHA